MTLNELRNVIDIDIEGSLVRFSNFEHTLKGICGNLGLTTLFNTFNEIVQCVRSGRNDEAIALCNSVHPEVVKTREAIAQLP